MLKSWTSSKEDSLKYAPRSIHRQRTFYFGDKVILVKSEKISDYNCRYFSVELVKGSIEWLYPPFGDGNSLKEAFIEFRKDLKSQLNYQRKINERNS